MPPWPCTIPLGRPVVPDEYSTHRGWSNGTGSNSRAPGSAVRSAQVSVPSNAAAGSRYGTSTTARNVGSCSRSVSTVGRTSNCFPP